MKLGNINTYRDLSNDDPALWDRRLRFLGLASHATPDFFTGLKHIFQADGEEVEALRVAWLRRFNVTDNWLVLTAQHTVWTWKQQLSPQDDGIQRPDFEWHLPGVSRTFFDPAPFHAAPTRIETRKEFVERASRELKQYATNWTQTYGDAARETDETGYRELAKYQANELHDPRPDQRARIRRAAHAIGLTLRPRNKRK